MVGARIGTPSVKSFINAFEGEESAVGDLARDLRGDIKARRIWGRHQLRAYLESVCAIPEALEACEDGFRRLKLLRQQHTQY